MSEEIKITDKRGQEKMEAPKKEPGASPEETNEQSSYQGEINFPSFILSLTTSAMVQMGLIENPESQKKEKNLELARQQISIIEMLNEKTKGNRSKDEDELMEQALYQLRMAFVEVSKTN